VPSLPDVDHVYDIVGVGFGPANLALAIAIAEAGPPERQLDALFLERNARFSWHRGMLLEGTTMQVSFLKDLATLRNPTSSFSFINYLHAHGRLADFVNHKVFFPSRIEFHDYLEWAAASFGGMVRYGVDVFGIQPVVESGDTWAFDVTAEAADDGILTWRTRNLVLGMGIVPRLPPGVSTSARVWHSSELLTRLADATSPVARFAVVGAGQSAGEIAAYLHDTYPRAEVFVIVPRYGFTPADDSPFVNGVFDPAAVDPYFYATPDVKARVFEYHASTNYSVVDADLIQELYRRVYQEKVQGTRRLHILRMTRVAAIHAEDGRVRLVLDMMLPGHIDELAVDVVVCATGYGVMDAEATLGPTADLCERDAAGRLVVGRDYRVVTAPTVRAGIYLQGGTEHTHGLSASLLSNIAVRAGEIVEAVTREAKVDDVAGWGVVRA